MAAITVTTIEGVGRDGRKTFQDYGTGASNSADTLTSAVVTKRTRRLRMVTCAYSGTPTQAGVTVTLDSARGSGYDTLLTTGSANARYTVYVPDEDILLTIGDAILVAAPAGGSMTAAITILTEEA